MDDATVVVARAESSNKPPRWWRPWSDEVTWQAQARKTAVALENETFLTWLDGAGYETAKLSFGAVWRRSAFVAKWLLGDVGLAPGDVALLAYAPGPEFFVAFLACLRAGVLAVPNYPPDPASLERGLEKLDIVCQSCSATVGLVDHTVRALRIATHLCRSSWPRIEWYNTENLVFGAAAEDDSPFFFLKHGSARQRLVELSSSLARNEDSTEEEKTARRRRSLDVRLGETKSSRLHNLHGFTTTTTTTERVVAVSWLPQFHDTGLMLMLLCTKRAARADVSNIDLSCVVYLVGGAACFAVRCNLRDDGNGNIFVPNYGLAEHVVATCGEAEGLVLWRRRPDLASCGSDFQIDLRIVDAETRRVAPDGTRGELWLSSGSVAQGYWGKPDLSKETFHAQLEPDNGHSYLRTGDEAFIEDGHLFLRLRDDVELAAATNALAVRPGCIAAFAIDGADDNERLCIVLEVRDTATSECETLASMLTKRVHKAVGLRPHRIVFIIKQKTNYFEDHERKASTSSDS
ncbi:hypothetical protein CTAYLR_004006 [Chrysophaeum taylorii]|uniref:AMP-dependent synthetase/ligase domain-containing protein n=1 Tax=Chrysophaeum taylorii TaxID=2483200 RepID=A0AAD7XFX2_9STRA|nr:hypothetical protein CTAYLR_004006 [Chrysophaeum taylorii]